MLQACELPPPPPSSHSVFLFAVHAKKEQFVGRAVGRAEVNFCLKKVGVAAVKMSPCDTQA